MKRLTLLTMLAAFLFVPTAPAFADEGPAIVDESVEKMAEEDVKAIGWKFGVSLGANMSFAFNDKVVGAQDGSSFQFGLVFDGLAGYFGKEHEWVNELGIKETVSKTPTIDSFLKTQDQFDFSTTYFYRPPAIPWLGPFARFRLTTAIFPGYDVRDADVQIYKGVDVDDGTGTGTTTRVLETVAAQKKIKLTDWFEAAAAQAVGRCVRHAGRKEGRLPPSPARRRRPGDADPGRLRPGRR